jgi:hypothetical protein
MRRKKHAVFWKAVREASALVVSQPRKIKEEPCGYHESSADVLIIGLTPIIAIG